MLTARPVRPDCGLADLPGAPGSPDS